MLDAEPGWTLDARDRTMLAATEDVGRSKAVTEDAERSQDAAEDARQDAGSYRGCWALRGHWLLQRILNAQRRLQRMLNR